MRLAAVLLGIAVLSVDLLSKHWVQQNQWLAYSPYRVIDGLLTIHYVRNDGIAFGILDSVESVWKPFLLTGLAIVAVCVVSYYIWVTPHQNRLTLFSLGLLLGGILGNCIDRAMNHYVVDFLKLHWKDQLAWPTFNVADAAISLGVFLILLESLFLPRSGSVRAPEEQGEAGAPASSTEKVLCSSLLAAILLFPATLDSPAAVAERLQQKYDSLHSFSAEFEQILSGRAVDIRESGIVEMQKPGKMYWEYREPTPKFFVADGRQTFFYVPKDRQLLISRLELQSTDSPLLFLLGEGNLREDFQVEFAADEQPLEPGNLILKLIPWEPQGQFSFLILEIDPSTYLIRRLTVVEPIGNRNEYILREVKENVRIPDGRFKLKVPSNVEIIEQN